MFDLRDFEVRMHAAGDFGAPGDKMPSWLSISTNMGSGARTEVCLVPY